MLKANNPRNQKKLDTAFECFSKIFGMMDTNNEHEQLMAYHRATEKIEVINGLVGRKKGEPKAFGFVEFVRLSMKRGGNPEEVRQFRQQIKRLFEQNGQLTKERDQAKKEAKAARTEKTRPHGKHGLRWHPSAIPWLQQLVAGVVLTVGIMISTKFLASWLFYYFLPRLHIVFAGCMAAPYLCKAMGMLGWGLGTLLDQVQHYIYVGAIQAGKFALFVFSLFGLSTYAAHASEYHQILGMPLPRPELSWDIMNWLGTYWNDAVFIGLIVASFALYCILEWAWIHRPDGMRGFEHWAKGI